MRTLLTTLAIAALGCGVLAQTQNLVYLTNDTDVTGTAGTGIAGDIGNDPVNAATRKVVVADINGDGIDDVFFMNHDANSVGMLNDGNGVFANDTDGGALYAFTSGQGAKGVAFGNVDGDADLDCFVATGPIGGVQQPSGFLLNISAGGVSNFLDVTPAMSVGTDLDHSYDAAFLTLGGVQHIAVANRIIGGDAANGGQNRLYTNAGGDFTAVAPVDGQFQTDNVAQIMSSRDLVVADFDNDGDDDLFCANYGNGGQENLMFVQSGGALVQDAFSVTPSASFGAAAADLNGDGLPELLLANRLTGTTGEANVLFENTTTGADDVTMVASTLTVLDDALEPSFDVVFADLDTDGDQDVFVANNSARNQVYINNQVEDGVSPFEAGSFTEVVDGLLQSNRGLTRSAAVAEFADYGPDGNHQAAEVVFANTNAGDNEFYRGVGQQYVDLGGATSVTVDPVLSTTGFMSPTTGGSLQLDGGMALGGIARLIMNLTDDAVPLNGGTLISNTPAFSSTNFGLFNGSATINVAAGDIPAALSGNQVFMQCIVRDSGIVGQQGLSNRFSVVIQ